MGTRGMTVRRMAAIGIALALPLAATSLAGAEPGDGGGGDGGRPGPGFFGGGQEGNGVAGRAVSRGESDTYGLALRAHGEGEEARGRLFFGHRGGDSEERLAGEVTCLAVGDDGVVQVSGSTGSGHAHHDHGFGPGGGDRAGEGDGQSGEESKGQDFAFTILTKSDPQQFSLPRLGEAGTLTPCGGGEDETVPVTRGGFRTAG